MFGKHYHEFSDILYNERLGHYMVYVGDTLQGEVISDQEISVSDEIELSTSDDTYFFTFKSPTSISAHATIEIDGSFYKFEILSRKLTVNRIYYSQEVSTQIFESTTYENTELGSRIHIPRENYKYYVTKDIQNNTQDSFSVENNYVVLNPDFVIMDGDMLVEYDVVIDIEYDRLINVIPHYIHWGTSDEITDLESEIKSFYFKDQYEVKAPYIEGFTAVYPAQDEHETNYEKETFLYVPDDLKGGGSINLYYFYQAEQSEPEKYTITVRHLSYQGMSLVSDTYETVSENEYTNMSSYALDIDNYKYYHSNPQEDFQVTQNTTIKLYYVPAAVTLTVIKQTRPLDTTKNITKAKDYEYFTSITKQDLYDTFDLGTPINGYTLDQGVYNSIRDPIVISSDEKIVVEYYQTPKSNYILNIGEQNALYCDSSITKADISVDTSDPYIEIDTTQLESDNSYIIIRGKQAGECVLSIGDREISIIIQDEPALIIRHICGDNDKIKDAVITITDESILTDNINPQDFYGYPEGTDGYLHCEDNPYETTPNEIFSIKDYQQLILRYKSKRYSITVIHQDSDGTILNTESITSVLPLTIFQYSNLVDENIINQGYLLTNGNNTATIDKDKTITLIYSKKNNDDPGSEENEDVAFGWMTNGNGKFAPKTLGENFITDAKSKARVFQYGTSTPNKLQKGAIYFVI